jgi:hypothetical protein
MRRIRVWGHIFRIFSALSSNKSLYSERYICQVYQGGSPMSLQSSKFRIYSAGRVVLLES